MSALIYITFGVLIILFGINNLYGGYELENPLIAGLGFGSILVGAIAIMFGISRRNTKTSNTADQNGKTEQDLQEIISESQEEHSHSGRAEYKALIQSMGVVAVADKRIRQVEIDTIIRIYSEMLGLRITDLEVREILSEFDDHFDIEERLQNSQSQISSMMKRTIIQCCQKVMVSDLEIAPSEQKRINEIGIALGMAESEIEYLIASESK